MLNESTLRYLESLPRDENGWFYTTFSPEDPETISNLSGWRNILELWQSRRRPPALPAWEDFDFFDFRGWHGWISVLERVSRDPVTIRVRLWGSHVAEFTRSDPTGQSFTQAGLAADPDVASQLAANDIPFYDRILDQGAIGLYGGPTVYQDSATDFYETVLPLTSGAAPRILLCCSALHRP